MGGLLATRIDGVFYIPVYGANGNIMMYVSESGLIAAQYDYDPYGNILQATGPLASQFAFGFSTKYHDREVGLVAYQLRTYNPTYGRWLNRDPIGEVGGENLYCFCGNSINVEIDLLGHAKVVATLGMTCRKQLGQRASRPLRSGFPTGKMPVVPVSPSPTMRQCQMMR